MWVGFEECDDEVTDLWEGDEHDLVGDLLVLCVTAIVVKGT